MKKIIIMALVLSAFVGSVSAKRHKDKKKQTNTQQSNTQSAQTSQMSPALIQSCCDCLEGNSISVCNKSGLCPNNLTMDVQVPSFKSTYCRNDGG